MLCIGAIEIYLAFFDFFKNAVVIKETVYSEIFIAVNDDCAFFNSSFLFIIKANPFRMPPKRN